MVITGIYQIQSRKKPERIYIGSSVDIHKRWYYHILELKRGTHANSKLQRHYNKYGKDDLIFSIILSCDKGDLILTEQYFIDAKSCFFNICKKAGSSVGRPPWNKGIKTGIKSAGSFKPGNIPWSKGKKWKLRKPRKPMSEEQRKSIGEHSKKMWAEKKAAGIVIPTGRRKNKDEVENVVYLN